MKRVQVPLWRPIAFCLLMATLAILLGLAVVLGGPKSLASPAYKPLHVAPYGVWGTFYLVPGTVAATLVAFGVRRNAFIPLLVLGGYETLWTAVILLYAITNPMALTGAALFGIFAASTTLAALTAADLP